MTRRLSLLDRVAALLLGLALVAGGLALVDWRYGVVLSDYPDRVVASAADDVLTSSWWPWAFAVGGVVLGLLGLAWLLAHTPRRTGSTLRLVSSDPTGRVGVDLGSVADVVAQRYADLTLTTGVHGRVASRGRRRVIEIRGHVDESSDIVDLAQAASACAADLAAAFPDEQLTCRVLLGSPQRRRVAQDDRVQVG